MEILKFESSTRSSIEAAKELSCELDQIIKTLIFHADELYFVVILQGSKRIDYQKIKTILGIKRPNLASPEKVLEISGYPVGGVMPVFNTKLPVLLDKGVLEYDIVYGGGGDINLISKVTPEEIIDQMNPRIEDISL